MLHGLLVEIQWHCGYLNRHRDFDGHEHRNREIPDQPSWTGSTKTVTSPTPTFTIPTTLGATSTTSTFALTSTVQAFMLYAACLSPNVAGTVYGDGISGVISDPGSGIVNFAGVTTDTAEDNCCMSCITHPNCAIGSFFAPHPACDEYQLIVASDGTACITPGQYDFPALVNGDGPDSDGFDGNCAEVGGVD
ncbi:uncharacterized protein A1O5_12743 [Cladophialophora psammophila CBS 110553]|uniref:Uncharacterized protein n=1 Tax=Cladophialophora psammophila CBS 110553 TaxID=1182543 RepID=W9W8W7_9EURO|nr:uncharacterized protein A1O5_12743 [Cladophialophora psammophila CBS 110553]EXJ55004.1 hypothetical protein A1O5_12743 [Cladophialophora psammophila CBS 110553]